MRTQSSAASCSVPPRSDQGVGHSLSARPVRHRDRDWSANRHRLPAGRPNLGQPRLRPEDFPLRRGRTSAADPGGPGARAVRTPSASRPSPDLPSPPFLGGGGGSGTVRGLDPIPTRVRSRWGARLRSSSAQAVNDSALQRPGAAVCRPSPLPDRPEIPAGHRSRRVVNLCGQTRICTSRHDLQISEVGIGELRGQASVLDDVPHDEGGGEFLHAGQDGELGVVEVLEAA